MEDFTIDIMIDKGPSARRSIKYRAFTLVGATTRLGNLTSPLRDRFGVVLRVDYYEIEEVYHIINRSSAILEIEITDGGAMYPKSRGHSVGKPYIKKDKSFAEVKGSGKIDVNLANYALEKLGIDKGLDDMDRKILTTIMTNSQVGQ